MLLSYDHDRIIKCSEEKKDILGVSLQRNLHWLLMQKQQAIAPKILTAEKVLETLREYPNLFEKFQIKTLALFGSTVHNEATESSDLDFLVEFRAQTTLNLYMNLKFFLEELFDKSVDLVTKKSLKEIIRDQVLAEAKYV